MKTKIIFATAISSFFILHSALGQGALTPPGAPAPLMKSLNQIEPRTPVSSAPFVITNPGAYYLTANLTITSGNAIVIATNGVSLDLNGFTLKSSETSPAGYAVLINSGLHNLTIVNGFIEGGITNNGSGVYSGPGFFGGISVAPFTTFPLNARISGVSVTGCQNYGIYVGQGDATVVESCTVRVMGGSGIVASTVRSCLAKDCGGTAILGTQVSDTRGEGGGYGVYAMSANNCYGFSPGSTGLNASTAENCVGVSIAGTGLDAGNANNCSGFSTNSIGLFANTANNCYGSSTNYTGLDAAYAANNCAGYSIAGAGLVAGTATGCYGYSNGSGTGLYLSGNGINCSGTSNSGFGLYGYGNLNNCSGYSSTSTGLGAYDTATGCSGYSNGSGDGLDAYIANNCTGYAQGGGNGVYAWIATGCYGISYSGTAVRGIIASGCVAQTTYGTPYAVSHNVNSF